MSLDPEAGVERIALSRSGDAIEFGPDGFYLESRGGRRQSRSICYRDITHFAAAGWGVWIATRGRMMAIRRGRFRDTNGPDRVARRLNSEIARQPGGLDQLIRIAKVQDLARNPSRQLTTRIVALLCVFVYVLQRHDSFVQEVGALIPLLVEKGQLWRLVTANFLHAVSLIPLHLIFNLLGLLGLAVLVERPLGSRRTAVIMGVSGICAMSMSFAVDNIRVVGASGMVMGLAGAAMCLELHHGDRLPTWWRVPRLPFFVILIAEGIKDYMIPGIAGEAHVGGFVAGYLCTLLLGGPERGPGPWLNRAAWSLAAIAVVSFALTTPLILRNGSAMERYALQLFATTELGADSDNDMAWRMATESDANFEELAIAQALAERAVERTEGDDPDVLDTLAEVYFLRGDVAAALRVIDEAIRISSGEWYYVEQRKRFTGERDFEDRPEPPYLPWPLRERALEQMYPDPGIVI